MAFEFSHRLSVAATLFVFAAGAQADFTGLDWDVFVLPPYGPKAVRVYAEFSSPTDKLLSITGAQIGIGPEPFYQHPYGGATEPLAFLVQYLPELGFDSFVTIGLTETQPGVPPTLLSPGSAFQRFGFVGDWFTDPDSPLLIAGSDLSVLIGQFSFQHAYDHPCIDFDMVVTWKPETGPVVFSDVNSFICVSGCDPFVYRDLVPDGVVNGLDLAYLLSQWGPCGTSCPADLFRDDTVDFFDLFYLLCAWTD